jgi:hypothetical protein
LLPASERRAFPLIALFHSDVTLESWRDFVASFDGASDRGLVALEDMRGYIHAFFSFRVIQSSEYGRHLHVADLVVANLPGQSLLYKVKEKVEELAKDHGCGTVFFEVGESARRLAEDLQRLARDEGSNALFVYSLQSSQNFGARAS